MIRQKTKIFSLLIWMGDLGAAFLAFFFAYELRDIFPQQSYARLFPFSWYLPLLLVIVPVRTMIFYLLGLYRFWRGPGAAGEPWALLRAVGLASFVLGFAVFALKYHFVSRIFLLLFAGLDFLAVFLLRGMVRAVLRSLHRKNDNLRLLLMVGLRENALKIAQSIDRHKDLGFRILGFLASTEADLPPRCNGYPVLGRAGDLPRILETQVVDEVIFAVPQEELKEMENLFLLCEERGITARLAMTFFPHLIAKTHLEDLEGFPLLTFSTVPKNELLLFLRRLLDVGASLLLMPLLAPLLLIIAAWIRLDSPGPAIYRQVRCGLNGRKFTLYKFRSMHRGAEGERENLVSFNIMDGPVFKMKDDPRVTRMGRFLRRTSLDELPQLFNVLKGDMSFVGPRPPLPEEVDRYEGWQRRRLSMQPGITGLWQVSGRNDLDFNQWMKLDLKYIDEWSMWLDFKILLKTIPVVLWGKGAM